MSKPERLQTCLWISSAAACRRNHQNNPTHVCHARELLLKTRRHLQEHNDHARAVAVRMAVQSTRWGMEQGVGGEPSSWAAHDQLWWACARKEANTRRVRPLLHHNCAHCWAFSGPKPWESQGRCDALPGDVPSM